MLTRCRVGGGRRRRGKIRMTLPLFVFVLALPKHVTVGSAGFPPYIARLLPGISILSPHATRDDPFSCITTRARITCTCSRGSGFIYTKRKKDKIIARFALNSNHLRTDQRSKPIAGSKEQRVRSKVDQAASMKQLYSIRKIFRERRTIGLVRTRRHCRAVFG